MADGDQDARSMAAFREWRSVPEHDAAYAEIDAAARALRAEAQSPGLLALRQEALAHVLVAAQPRPRRWLAGGLAACLAVVAGGWFLAQHRTPVPSASHPADTVLASGRAQPVEYVTAIGQRLPITLPDGSTAVLNTSSALRLAYDDRVRRIELLAGQAVFRVAKGQRRPFEVVANGRVVTAHGTSFEVRIDGTTTRVGLLEGRVTVAGSGMAEVGLSPRQTLIVTPQGSRIRAMEPAEQGLSWEQGMVVFDNTRLADAVAEFNRYVRRPIVLGDPALADVRVSGAFRAGDRQTFTEALSLYFPARIADQPQATVVTSGSAEK